MTQSEKYQRDYEDTLAATRALKDEDREMTRLKLPATKGDVERLEAKVETVLAMLQRMERDDGYRDAGLKPPHEVAPPDLHDRVRLPRGE